jgi:hypothetical protein
VDQGYYHGGAASGARKGEAMSKNGIIGNEDVAPLYDPAVHPDVARRVLKASMRPAQQYASGSMFTAERIRPGLLTLHGVRGPQRVERITIGAPSVKDAIQPMKEIARQYFQSSQTPWRVGNHVFIT